MFCRTDCIIFHNGKIIERVSGVDANAETPVQRLEDGVDYTPIGKFKLFLIHFLRGTSLIDYISFSD